MSISTMTTIAYRRRTDVATAAPPEVGLTSAKAATLAGEVPETQSGVTSALATITAYIPTEILITYVAVATALSGSQAASQGVAAASSSAVGLWLNFAFFLIATPLVVWLVYAGKVRTAGKPQPRAIDHWPRWEMVAATAGYMSWAFALPGSPFAGFSWYNGGVAGVVVLVTATMLGLLTPVVGGPLAVGPVNGVDLTPAPGSAGPAPAAGAAAGLDRSAPVPGASTTSSAAVEGFLPSRSGFHFANAFPHEALITVEIPGIATLPLGDAANGLCGGMASAAYDLFEASVTPPPDTVPPPSGTPRYDYLVARQVASLDEGRVALRLYELGSPVLPDGAPGLGPVGALELRGRSQVMVLDEWPAIQTDLDEGHPCLLGLVRVIDADPRTLGRDHQVLAYGYELDGDELSVAVYDPNHPDDDSVRLSLSIADPSLPIQVAYSPDDGPVHCFIRIPYATVDPAPWR